MKHASRTDDGDGEQDRRDQHPTRAQQSEHLRQLIKFARERDALGKEPASRAQLIAALVTLGRTREEAEREIENARVRVRRAADKAEDRLEFYMRNTSLWEWTHPREAIQHMRSRAFGIAYMHAPLTDIEEGLVSKGNVLFIVAIYPAMQSAIWTRLRQMSLEAREVAEDSPPPSSADDDPRR